MTKIDSTQKKTTKQKRMPLLYSQEEIIAKFKEKHGDIYDYSLVIFSGTHKKVKIICRKHGVFDQVVKSHIKGHGCGWCGSAYQYTKEMFVEKAISIHGDKYNYDDFEYKNFGTKSIIRCAIHGAFLQTPAAHLRGNGCFECGQKSRHDKHRTKLEDFIKKSRKVHGLKFDYSGVRFNRLKDEVRIKCPSHGEFLQVAATHLHGSDCPQCVMESCRGFSRSAYVNLCKEHGDSSSNLYVIKCHDENEAFYKIGITKESRVDKRFAYGKIPYEFELISTLNGEAGFIYDLETQLHRLLRAHKYIPIKDFAGKQECFSKLPSRVSRMLSKLNKSDQIQLIA